MPKKKRIPRDAVILAPEDVERLHARYLLYERARADAEHAQAVAMMLGESYGLAVREVRELYSLSRVYTVNWETGVVTAEPDPEPSDG